MNAKQAIAKIRTDHKWKPFVYLEEVPKRILKEQFDHLDEETVDGFFKYCGFWYHTSDFMRVESKGELSAWDGYAEDSYFSGTLIRISKDGESFQVGRYNS